MKRLIIFFFALAIFLFSPKGVLALTVSISNLPSTMDQSQEAEVDITLSCSGCGDSYFRGVFYPSGSNYFGFTKNNLDSWIGSVSDRTQYFKVANTDLVEGVWSGKLRIKPDPADSIYTGSGNYFFKVGRYTSASDSSADWSDELTVAITGPTPTPTSTPEPTSISTPSPTPTTLPTLIPSLVPSRYLLAASPSPTPTKILAPSRYPLTASTAETEFVLAAATTLTPTTLPTVTSTVQENKPSGNLFPVILIGVGMLFLTVSGVLLFKTSRDRYT